MERESFEDEEVARYLGEHFVAIKVDREERPDIDHIYMSVCQAMTGQGGWPLTVVMTPDKKPFFAGTYFPKRRQYGRLGLLELLERLVQVWTTDRAKAEEAGEQIAHQLQNGALLEGDSSHDLSAEGNNEPSLAICRTAVDRYRKEYDPVYGGFGSAPKFPSPHNLSFLLRHSALFHDTDSADMAMHTLECMYKGGLWDHVGFGFARYSTDEMWLVPHFEKMLYDNALLAHAFLDALAYRPVPFYERVVKQIFTYVLREMTSPEGAFYSAQDADSEGEEGKFYLFTQDELRGILGDEDASWFGDLFGVTGSGNFEGSNILNLVTRAETAFSPLSDPEDPLLRGADNRLRSCRDRLYSARAKRIPPHKDDKILTSWNGLMIAAFAKAARMLDMPAYLQVALRALGVIDRNLTRSDGRLLARYREGEAKHLGYLEDYAYMGWALLELYESTFAPEYLARLKLLANRVQALFADEKAGGYFFYGVDAEVLLTRPKEFYDGAMPSGNSVWAHVLARLALLTGDAQIERWRDRQVAACFKVLSAYPTGFSHGLMALQVALSPPVTIVLAATEDNAQVQELLTIARSHSGPSTGILLRTDATALELAQVAPFTAQQVAVDHHAVSAYVCVGFACRRPVHSAQDLVVTLAQASRSSF